MNKKFALGALSLGLAALAAQAAVTLAPRLSPAQGAEERVPASQVAGGALPADAARPIARTPAGGGVQPANAGPTEEEVGDADSFGRNVRWLGLVQANVELLDACPPDEPDDDSVCQPVAPSGTTVFDFQDVARVVLPARASQSLLCHWLSPYLTLGWSNPGATPVLGTLTYTPTLTIESPVLDDPALIDPTTGAPFGGRLQAGMTASERLVAPLSPGMAYTERQRDSAVCIAGFISRRALIQNYGLTESQADRFFRKPITIRMNVRGTATHLEAAQLVFGLRIVGD